ncbi:MAG: hypothetical protein AB7G06_06470 [Bdellovibrionales bacterium]
MQTRPLFGFVMALALLVGSSMALAPRRTPRPAPRPGARKPLPDLGPNVTLFDPSRRKRPLLRRRHDEKATVTVLKKDD